MKALDPEAAKLYEDIQLNVVDFEDFNSRVVGAYNAGTAE
jgi:hypothetical protein